MINKTTRPRFFLTQYLPKGEVTSVEITAEEKRVILENRAIDSVPLDFLLSYPDSVFAFRDESGSWIDHCPRWPRMGRVTLDLLLALQLNPGLFLTPSALRELTGHESLFGAWNLAGRVRALRMTLHDRRGRFIVTRRNGGYAVQWESKRGFCWIEPLPQIRPSSENGEVF